MTAPGAVPIQEYVLKVAGRCNLACDYCYVYEMADHSWRDRPSLMSSRTVETAAARIGEHAAAHHQPHVSVVLHGGEPLLAGAAFLDHAAGTLRAALPAGTELSLRIQTNGTLLTAQLLDVLRRHRVGVGISMDGGEDHHDRHRLDPRGQGSYPATARAVGLLDRDLFTGLLCVVDLANDPVAVYESLVSFRPPAMDFLLPHGNWTAPPPGRPPDLCTPYADWLIAVFDRWYGAEHRETEVRLFAEIVNLLLGGRSATEQIGLSPAAFLVVDTDGSFQQVDALKSVRPGAPETGMTVFEHTVDEVLGHPRVRDRQRGLAALSSQCRRCPVVRVCGGGNYVHRYRDGHGFAHPSVYCADLAALIGHISGRVRADLAGMAALAAR